MTNHFSIDLETTEDSLRGIYCSYCGQKIIPSRNENDGSFEFNCTCKDAIQELEFIQKQKEIEIAYEQFLTEKEPAMKLIETQTRLRVHSQYVEELAKKVESLKSFEIVKL